MNCLEFEKNVIDLTKGIAESAALKNHALECSRCATSLRNATALTDSFQRVAREDMNVAPPLHLESALLASFRQPHQVKQVQKAGVFDSLIAFFNQMKWGLAAATVLLLLGIAAAQIFRNGPDDTAQKGKLPLPIPSVSVPEPAPELVIPEDKDNRIFIAEANKRSGRIVPVGIRSTPIRNVQKADHSVSAEIGEFEVIEQEKPLSAKDFIAFDYAETMPPADNLQVMRVPLSREKLASMGLIMPRSNRQSPFVNADLLVGSDGVPRAINVAHFR